MDIEIIGKLSGIGTDVTQTREIGGNDAYNAVLRWARDVVADMAAKVDEYGAKATLNLMQSIRVREFDPNAENVKIEIIADDYWRYVNYGVDGVNTSRGLPYKFRYIRPSKRHVEAIKKWI